MGKKESVYKEKISVIVPIFNTEKYIKNCIDSIISQTYNNLEIILIDDGSKDRSGEICDEYQKKDKRIQVVHKENGGQSSARNRGLDIATGDYIAFVDSDDTVENEMYEKLLSFMKRKNLDIAVCNYYTVQNGNKSIAKRVKHNYVFNTKQAMKILPKNDILDFSPCNRLFHRSVFEGLRFEEGVIYEDQRLSYRYFSRARRVGCFTEPLYNYYQRENSTIRGSINLNVLQSIEAYEDMEKYYKNNFPKYEGIVYLYKVKNAVLLYEFLILSSVEEKKYRYIFRGYSRKKLLKSLYQWGRIEREKIPYIAIVSPCLAAKVVAFYVKLQNTEVKNEAYHVGR